MLNSTKNTFTPAHYTKNKSVFQWAFTADKWKMIHFRNIRFNYFVIWFTIHLNWLIYQYICILFWAASSQLWWMCVFGRWSHTYIHTHTCCDTLTLSAPFNKLGQIMDSLSCRKTSWWMFSYISLYLTSSVGSNSVSKLYKATPINHFNSLYHPNKNMILNYFWHSKLILLISEHPVWTSQHRPILGCIYYQEL